MDTNFVPQSGPSTAGKFVKLAGLLAVVAVVGVGAWSLTGDRLSGDGKVLGVDTSYQAVFLTNGQVYFGKLSANGDWIELRDIYYLQVTQQLQPAPTDAATPPATNTNTQPNIQLVKLGSELHGPQDVMHIDKDKVLFWENMKDDSKVVEAIKKYQETK